MAIITIGMTLIIVTRNIDLSVGSVAALAGAVGGVLNVRMGWPADVSLAAACFAGLLDRRLAWVLDRLPPGAGVHSDAREHDDIPRGRPRHNSGRHDRAAIGRIQRVGPAICAAAL